MTIPAPTPIASVPLRTQFSNDPDFQAAVEVYLLAQQQLSVDEKAMVDALIPALALVEAQAAQVAADKETTQDLYALLSSESLSEFNGSSASSVTIGIGSKSFIANSGKLWRTLQWVMIRSAADSSKWMSGPITSYDVTDGNPLVVDVQQTNGSGSFADWLIYPTMPPTPSHKLAAITKSDTATTSSTTWADTGLDVTITLDEPAQRVLLNASLMVTINSTGILWFRLLRGATVVGQGASAGSRERILTAVKGVSGGLTAAPSAQVIDTPGSVGPHTYKLQWRFQDTSGSPTAYLNRDITDSDSASFPRGASVLTALQVGAA